MWFELRFKNIPVDNTAIMTTNITLFRPLLRKGIGRLENTIFALGPLSRKGKGANLGAFDNTGVSLAPSQIPIVFQCTFD